MSKLIAIDDGHGMDTFGKRTPKFENGTFMKENEFNRAVANYLKIDLERCGFKTLTVAPTDKDISLKQRVDLANNKKADFYISIHANALTGEWGSQNGIETYYYTGSIEGKKTAKIIHTFLMQGSTMTDRGVKTANFYVLKNTNMPAVLVECGFMDNLREAKLLMSEEYRRECAEEIAKGICKYFNVKYKNSENKLKQISVLQNSITIKYNDRKIDADNFIYSEITYVPLRFLTENFGKIIDWDEKNKIINIKDVK